MKRIHKLEVGYHFLFLLPNNRTDFDDTVAHRPSLSGDCTQRSLLSNAYNIHSRNKRRAVFSVVQTATVARQRRGKHASTSEEELCFLCDPCRRVINGTSLELSSVVRM
jgi:hypothetical protein